MRYMIDRSELADFVAHQVELVECLPAQGRLAAEAGYGPDGLDPQTLEAVWLAAGLAAFIGQVICDEPERFIVAACPSGLAA